MHEEGSPTDGPQEQLIPLLTLDFTPTVKVALWEASHEASNPLGKFLANARSTEDIDARLASEENLALGEHVTLLVASAPITESFKGFIASEVRLAHAWERPVDSVISPDGLGLSHGAGIFDPAQAKSIEAQTLREHTFDWIRHDTFATPEGSDLPPLIRRPEQRPQDFAAKLTQLFAWVADYLHTYGEDPFEGIDDDAFLAAAKRSPLPEAAYGDPEDVEESGLVDLIQRLNELRNSDEEA